MSARHEQLSKLLGKKVKIVYKEFENQQIGRGVLTDFSDDFITLEGDYSDQIIPIANIQKISFLKIHDVDHDGARS